MHAHVAHSTVWQPTQHVAVVNVYLLLLHTYMYISTCNKRRLALDLDFVVISTRHKEWLVTMEVYSPHRTCPRNTYSNTTQQWPHTHDYSTISQGGMSRSHILPTIIEEVIKLCLGYVMQSN